MTRVTVLTPLMLLACSLQAIGESPSPSADSAPPATNDGELKLVVALFRHGVRAPLLNFSKTADTFSGQKWPPLSDWVPPGKTWGDLTPRGRDLATAMGVYYAKRYTANDAWRDGFNLYLWADTDPRTIDTATALADGFKQGGLPDTDITVSSLQSKLVKPATPPKPAKPATDSLFHPFEAKCGVPDKSGLNNALADIQKKRVQTSEKYYPIFQQLYVVLACNGTSCTQLKNLDDDVTLCTGSDCESPIAWTGTFKGTSYTGQFPYASSASEAFLLEYANGMPANQVGWGNVDAATTLHSMLQLHESYFDLTEREPYIAKIQGSNLTREILDLLNRKAGRHNKIDGKCPRGNEDSQFIGLVGHDTNLASLNELLGMSWEFTDASLAPGEKLPADTVNLPANDALPAGALVFELRQRASGYFIRVNYVAQSLLQMNGNSERPPTAPYRFNVTCHDEANKPVYPCDMSLDTFNKVAANAIGTDNKFLSGCDDHNEVCP